MGTEAKISKELILAIHSTAFDGVSRGEGAPCRSLVTATNK